MILQMKEKSIWHSLLRSDRMENEHELEKQHSIQCLEDLLKHVKEDKGYIMKIDEVWYPGEPDECKIRFELHTRYPSASMVDAWGEEEPLRERPWWKFWKG